MIYRFAFICTLLLSGCSIFQPSESFIIQPRLLKQSALPPIKQSLYEDSFEFYCEMNINENGDVTKVKIFNQAKDPIWDSLATLSMLNWKFSPAIINGEASNIVVRRKFKVIFQKPAFMQLAEIQLYDIQLSDSLYKLLLGGADFFELARLFSLTYTSDKHGMLGDVDINFFSEEIQKNLKDLDEGDFTKPLKYGDRFIIFKRLKADIQSSNI